MIYFIFQVILLAAPLAVFTVTGVHVFPFEAW